MGVGVTLSLQGRSKYQKFKCTFGALRLGNASVASGILAAVIMALFVSNKILDCLQVKSVHSVPRNF